MENPFKKILHHEEVPQILRNKVLNDVAMIKLTIDVADLFVVKYPKTIEDIVDGISATQNQKEEKETEDKDNNNED
ncbi:hypothetical protein AAON49_04855 [Pseudotenacibaculum sp. MALMAid0570]|uniref:hypothetical protein n=1 Tax=Pseudotenacibaculum sp. MALMAid0570 TaxID=3143938 RepID=UPI0032DFF31B